MRSRMLLVLAFAVVAPLAARAQNISTVAGGGPINLPALTASIGAPAAVRQDSLGNTYILDNQQNRVYVLDTTGNLTVFAGTGAAGAAGDGGPAAIAELNQPSGMCIDSSNNLYIADSDNNKIRIVAGVTAGGKTKGDIYTFAGPGGLPDYNGDGGLPVDAFLHFPDGCALDSKGNLYIADRGNNEVRVVIGALNMPPPGVTGTTAGHIYNFAGDAAATPPGGNPPPGYSANGTVATHALLDGPFDVFVDSHDNVYIADLGNNFLNGIPDVDPTIPQNNNVIREVPATTTVTPPMTAGSIYTIVGTPGVYGHSADGTPALAAKLNQAMGLSVDAHGNLFFADSANQVIREVPAVTAGSMTAGDIYDVAGTAGAKGYSGDNGPALSASLSFPVGTLVTANDDLFIADSNSDAIREVPAVSSGTMTAGDIYTISGNGHLNFGGDGALATHGELNAPSGVAADNLGNLAIADQGSSLIRGVSVITGDLSTISGEPEFNGFIGDNSSAPTSPSVVNGSLTTVFDASGNEFIADTLNCVVREIAAGNIFTVAGTDPTPNSINPEITTPVCGFGGATGLATSATLGKVNGVAVDHAGNIFFSDSTNNIIWEVAKNTKGGMTAGHIYIAAGTQQLIGSFGGDGGPAIAAQLNSPTGISFDVFGNLFIADTKNNIIREVPADNTTNPFPMNAGSIYTVAGNQGLGAGFGGDGAAATSAQLNNPFSMVVDHAGNIFIADTNNDVIREVTSADGKINTVAGTSLSAGFSGDGGAATAAKLNNPQGLALDGAGDLLLADSANNRVRSIANLANVAAVPVASFDKTSLTFATQLLNTPSAAQVVTLTNTGSAALSIASIALTGTNSGDFALAPASTCGASLAASANCTISVKFTPTVNGPRTASVTITDGAASSPQTVTLNGTGGLPTADLTGAPLTFTSQLVGTPSAAQNVTLTNNGTIALAITGITITGANSGDFALSPASTCGASLAIGANCTISVKFTPTAAGARAAAVSIADDLVASPQMFNLTGTGVAPGVGLNPASLTFATPQTLSTPSAPQSVKLTNTGSSVLTITGITITGANSGDFAFVPASTCGASLAMGANCTINVTFTPTANGTRTASVSIADSATGSPQNVGLTGTGGSPAASFNSSTLTFSNQVVSTPSAAQSVTLTNAGTVPLSITSITVSGANSADFGQTNTCGTSVAAGANCSISVVFTPGALGARSATVNVTDNAAASPQAITLNGAGVAAPPMASLSSTSLTFADQFVGTSSATAQTLTLTNNSTSALTITSVAITGANAGDYGQTNTCGTSLAASAKCTISVTFKPTTTGARPASITVTDNATPPTQTVTLAGSGFTVSLAAASGGSLSQTVKAGQTATWAVQLNPTGGGSTDTVNVSLACSGAPSLTTLNCPSTQAAPGTFNITAVTTGSAMLAPLSESEPQMQPPAGIRTLPVTLLAVLAFLAAMLAWMQSPAGRMRTVRVALTACLVLLPVSATMFLAGCASSGGSSTTTPPPAPSTPTGTYTITVTMTVGSAKPQSSQLTLIVQ